MTMSYHQASSKSFINVTEDGIAILLNSSPDIFEGFYTNGLETCIATTILGSEGIALIHNSGMLAKESIKNTAKKLGGIQRVFFHYNSKFYSTILNGNEKLACAINKNVVAVGMKGKILSAPYGFISVSKKLILDGKWKIAFNVNSKPSNITEPKKMDLRKDINQVNNYFLDGDADEKIEADIQYDGKDFLDIPPLRKSRSQIEELRTLPSFCREMREYNGKITSLTEMTLMQIKRYEKLDEAIQEHRRQISAKKEEHSLRGSMLDGFFSRNSAAKKEEKFKEAANTIIHRALAIGGTGSPPTPALLSKRDIIERLKRITPDICDVGFSWEYKESTKEAFIVADDKNIEQIKSIYTYFKQNNANGGMENIRYEFTPSGQPMLAFKLLKKDVLDKILILQTPSNSTEAVSLPLLAPAKILENFIPVKTIAKVEINLEAKRKLNKEEERKESILTMTDTTLIAKSTGLQSLSIFDSKIDVIAAFERITPDLCDTGAFWNYKSDRDGTRVCLVCDEEEAEQLEALCVHFKENNFEQSMNDIRIAKFPEERKIMLRIGLLKKDSLGKIPIFCNIGNSIKEEAATTIQVPAQSAK